jgi:hypothetical protein
MFHVRALRNIHIFAANQQLHTDTYLLTQWSRVHLEKLTGVQLVKKFPAFYGFRRFITAFTSARHLSPSWAISIQSITPRPNSWRSILILSSHLRLVLSRCKEIKYVLSYINIHRHVSVAFANIISALHNNTDTGVLAGRLRNRGSILGMHYIYFFLHSAQIDPGAHPAS